MGAQSQLLVLPWSMLAGLYNSAGAQGKEDYDSCLEVAQLGLKEAQYSVLLRQMEKAAVTNMY